MEQGSPCCSELRKRVSKLEEGRNALRQAVKLLEQQLDKVHRENVQLKQASEQERLQAENEKRAKKNDGCTIRELEKEIENLKAQLTSSKGSVNDFQLLELRVLEGVAEVERLKQLLDKEKKKADSEKKKVEAEKSKASEAWRLLKTEKNKTSEERMLFDAERKKAEEYRLRWESLKKEADETIEALAAEKTKVDIARKRAESERQKARREKKRADTERVHSEEASRFAEAEKNKALHEKARADSLTKQLEMERKNREELHKEMEQSMPLTKSKKCFLKHNDYTCIDIQNGDDIKLLKEKLKFEKKQLKHAKRGMKLQKAENKMLQRELHLLKQEFVQYSGHLKLLSGHLSRRAKGLDGLTKVLESPKARTLDKKSEFRNIIPHAFKSHGDNELARPPYTVFGPVDYFSSAKAGFQSSFPEAGVNFSQPAPGINFDLESPVGDSDGKKSQSFAECSATASFSDRIFMGSQERAPFSGASETTLAQNNMKHKDKSKLIEASEALDNLSKESRGKCSQRNTGSASLSSDICQDSELVSSVHHRKKRRIEDALDSVAFMYSDNKRFHMNIEKKLSTLNDLILDKKDMPGFVSSQIDTISSPLKRGGCLNSGGVGSLHRGKHSCHEKRVSKKQKCILLCDDKKEKLNTKVTTNGCAGLDLSTDPAQPAVQPMKKDGILSFQFDKRESKKQKCNLLRNGKKDKLNSKVVTHGCAGLDLSTEPAQPAVQPMNKDDNCSFQIDHCDRDEEQVDFLCFDNVVGGNIITLLELENDVDEKRYKAAIAMPLSPTLPILEPHSLRSCEDSRSDDLVEEMGGRNPEDNGNCLVPVQTFDLLDLETVSNRADLTNSSFNDRNSNSTDYHRSDTVSSFRDVREQVVECEKQITSHSGNNATKVDMPFIDLDNTIGAPHNVNIAPSNIETQDRDLTLKPFSQTLLESSSRVNENAFSRVDGESNLCSATTNRQSCILENLNFFSMHEDKKQMDLPTINRQLHSSEVSDELKNLPTSILCVAFSANKDRVSNIISAMVTFHSQAAVHIPTDGILMQILASFPLNIDLLPNENACVLFSLLLSYLCSQTPENSDCLFSRDLLSNSFEMELQSVISDDLTRKQLSEWCRIDSLFQLAEDFLLHREIIIYSDHCDMLTEINLVGHDFHLHKARATIHQLTAGSIILACLCKAFGHIAFLWEVSYKILRVCRKDSSWALTVLHTFASLCGASFFSEREHTLPAVAIKSVVRLLQLECEPVTGLSVISQSISANRCTFPLCKECPFAEDVGMDKIVTILLKMLDQYAISSIDDQHPSKSQFFSLYHPGSPDKSEQNAGQKSACCIHTACDRQCLIPMYDEDASGHISSIAEGSLCCFIDLLSLLEMVACYMDWCWTYKTIVCHLLKVIESCSSEKYVFGLLVLLGKLGRLGIDAGGYEQIGVTELLKHLSTFLESNAAVEGSFLMQLSTVGAMIDLFPQDFEEILNDGDRDTIDRGFCSQAKTIIRSWYSQLNDEQKFFSSNLFQKADVHSCDIPN